MRENCNDCGFHVFGETCTNDFRRILPWLIGGKIFTDVETLPQSRGVTAQKIIKFQVFDFIWQNMGLVSW